MEDFIRDHNKRHERSKTLVQFLWTSACFKCYNSRRLIKIAIFLFSSVTNASLKSRPPPKVLRAHKRWSPLTPRVQPRNKALNNNVAELLTMLSGRSSATDAQLTRPIIIHSGIARKTVVHCARLPPLFSIRLSSRPPYCWKFPLSLLFRRIMPGDLWARVISFGPPWSSDYWERESPSRTLWCTTQFRVVRPDGNTRLFRYRSQNDMDIGTRFSGLCSFVGTMKKAYINMCLQRSCWDKR